MNANRLRIWRVAAAAILVGGAVTGCGMAGSNEDIGGDRLAYSMTAADSAGASEMMEVAPSAPDMLLLAPPAPGEAESQNQVFSSTPLPPTIGQSVASERRIIKNADMVLEVEGVERAVGRVEAAAAQAGGYVLETRTDYAAGGLPMAVVGLAVPVDAFEATRERIREIGTKVISEHASGVDVSQEYVDLESEIANLEATQARIRSFLDQATSVEEALQVNARLTEIEGQISQRKGRRGYLEQRSAFSTLTVELRQIPLSVTPTPTPTATPRPAWNPAETADDALFTLSVVLRGLGALLIWAIILGSPFVLPFVAIYWFLRRRRGEV